MVAQQVQQGKKKDPDNINKVPVQPNNSTGRAIQEKSALSRPSEPIPVKWLYQ
jgi:hypothetical protein